MRLGEVVISETLTRVLEQAADTVLVAGRDGTIEYVNPAYVATTGYSRDEAVGRTPRIVRSGIQTPGFYETMWNTLASGRTFHATLTNRARDGRIFEHEQTISPVVDHNGVITHFAAIGRDVTQRQRGEAARVHYQLEQEAVRIAGLLHDEAGQFLALAHITLADMTRGLPPAEANRVLEVRRYLDYVEERLREISRGIQPRVVSDLGLMEAIRFLADGCERRNSITVTVESTLDILCPASIESLLYTFVRDGLTNVAMHAQATRASVVLAREVNGRRVQDNTISCLIRDNGMGFDTETLRVRDGGSLRALESRLAALGGTLDIRSTPGAGTSVQASIPVQI